MYNYHLSAYSDGLYKQAMLYKQAGTKWDAFNYLGSQLIDGTFIGSGLNKLISWIPGTDKNQDSLWGRITGKDSRAWAEQYQRHAAEKWGEEGGAAAAKKLRGYGIAAGLAGTALEGLGITALTGGLGAGAAVGGIAARSAQLANAGAKAFKATKYGQQAINAARTAGNAVKATKYGAKLVNGAQAFANTGAGRFVGKGAQVVGRSVGDAAKSYGKWHAVSSNLNNINEYMANGDPDQRNAWLDLAQNMSDTMPLFAFSGGITDAGFNALGRAGTVVGGRTGQLLNGVNKVMQGGRGIKKAPKFLADVTAMSMLESGMGDISNIGSNNIDVDRAANGYIMRPLQWMGISDLQGKEDAAEDRQQVAGTLFKIRTSPNFRAQFAVENGLPYDTPVEDLEAYVNKVVDEQRLDTYIQNAVNEKLDITGKETPEELEAKYSRLSPEDRQAILSQAHNRLADLGRYGAMEGAMTDPDMQNGANEALLRRGLVENRGFFDWSTNAVMQKGMQNRNLENAMAGMGYASMLNGGAQGADPTVVNNITQSVLNRASRDGNFAVDFMQAAQANDQVASQMPAAQKQQIMDTLTNMNPYQMFQTMDAEHLQTVMQFAASSEGSAFMQGLPPEQREAINNNFKEAGIARAKEEFQNNPFEFAPKAVSAWLQMQGAPEGLTQFISNPAVFYTAILGMGALASYGGYKALTN